jgi:hypothetical protein
MQRVVLHTNLGRSPLSSRLKDTLWNIAQVFKLEMERKRERGLEIALMLRG